MTESDGKGGWIPVWYKAGHEFCYYWRVDGGCTINGYCAYCGMPGDMHVRLDPNIDQPPYISFGGSKDKA